MAAYPTIFWFRRDLLASSAVLTDSNAEHQAALERFGDLHALELAES